MTLQNPKFKIFITIAIIIPTSLVIVSFASDSCGIKHIEILGDIQKYDETLDPEFCESIVHKIDNFNEKCEPEIEILDCG